jgi:hypothetical protein
MENTARHETVYKLAHRADKANFSSECDSTILTVVQFAKLHTNSECDPTKAKKQLRWKRVEAP